MGIIKRKTPSNVAKIVNKALDDTQFNPCKICPNLGVCEVKRKGYCKVLRNLRGMLQSIERLEE